MYNKVEDPRLQRNDGDKEGSFHNYQGDNSTMTKEYTKDMRMSVQKWPFCFLERIVEIYTLWQVYFAFPVIPKFGNPKTLCLQHTAVMWLSCFWKRRY